MFQTRFLCRVLVTVVTVLTDLAVAVAVGVIASALMFAWQHAKRIYADTSINQEGSKEYKLAQFSLDQPLIFLSFSMQ